MNRPTILIVEDDAPVRNLMVNTLRTHDYKYLTAPGGRALTTHHGLLTSKTIE